MIMHLMGATMYTKDFYSLVNTYFSNENHVFVNNLRSNDPQFKAIFGILSDSDIPIIRPSSLRFIKDAYKSDAIIFHGLFNIRYMIFFTLQPWLLKKCNWVIWGGDIYARKKKNKKLTEKVVEHLKLVLCRYLGYATTLADEDFRYFQDGYGFKGTHLKTKYPTPLTRKHLDKTISDNLSVNRGHQINIMIGNSATETNQHFQALDLLSRFRVYDLKLFIPLSYGDRDNFLAYGDKVIAYANSIFGEEKVKPIRKRMSAEEYIELISQMDIGLFNCNRQQAMGNIAILFASGAKIYLRSDTTMWSNYKERGNIIYNIEDIKHQSFEEFCQYDRENQVRNRTVIEQYTNININIERWKIIFNEITQQRH